MTDMIAKIASFYFSQRLAEFSHVLALMVKHGVPAEDASKVCLELAEITRGRGADDPAIQQYADLIAKQYEDIASMLLSGGLLPRDK